MSVNYLRDLSATKNNFNTFVFRTIEAIGGPIFDLCVQLGNFDPLEKLGMKKVEE